MENYEIIEGHRKIRLFIAMGLILLGKTRISMASDIWDVLDIEMDALLEQESI